MPVDPIEVLYVQIAADAERLLTGVKDAVSKAEKELEGVGDAAKNQEKGFISLGSAIKVAFALPAVQAFLGTIQKIGAGIMSITQKAIGFASSMQGVNVLFVNLLGSQAKANEFMAAMREQAAITGQNVVDMAMGSKRFLPYAEGNKEAFMNMVKAAQALAAADPFQGMMGAGLALEEFLSGTAGSLAMRFELPRAKLSEIAKMHGSIEEKMKALNQLLKEHGKGWDLVEAQLDTFSGQMGFLRGLWNELLLEFGTPIFDELQSGLKDVVGWVKENREEIIATAVKIGELVGVMLGNIKDLISGLAAVAEQLSITADKLPNLTPIGIITFWQQVGFIITTQVLAAVDNVIIGVTVLVETLKRLKEGKGLMPAEDVKRLQEQYKRSRVETTLRIWGLAPKEEKAPEEAPAEEEKGKAPPGLDEDAQKAALKGARKIEEIIKDFAKRVANLKKDAVKKLADIDKKEQDDYQKAVAKSQKAVEKAKKDHDKQQVKEQENFNKEWRRLIRDQHQEVLDAEWEFQYEEERLIAEGDTLALRDLRIRYDHEGEVRAREQEDARSDTQEDREKEKAERQETFQEELAESREQLAEQIQEIADNAAEAREKERAEFDERMAELVEQRDEKLQAIGEDLMSEKEMNTATANEIMALWAKVYGPEYMEQVQAGINADQARRESLGLLEQQAKDTAEALKEQAAAGASAGGWPSSRSHPSVTSPTSRTGGNVEFAQHGLDAIFNKPTGIIVGEGGVAEHVRVTPLGKSGGGGRGIKVDLSGNITVGGSALSPEAANLLIVKMAESVREGIARRPE